MTEKLLLFILAFGPIFAGTAFIIWFNPDDDNWLTLTGIILNCTGVLGVIILACFDLYQKVIEDKINQSQAELLLAINKIYEHQFVPKPKTKKKS